MNFVSLPEEGCHHMIEWEGRSQVIFPGSFDRNAEVSKCTRAVGKATPRSLYGDPSRQVC